MPGLQPVPALVISVKTFIPHKQFDEPKISFMQGDVGTLAALVPCRTFFGGAVQNFFEIWLNAENECYPNRRSPPRSTLDISGAQLVCVCCAVVAVVRAWYSPRAGAADYPKYVARPLSRAGFWGRRRLGGRWRRPPAGSGV